MKQREIKFVIPGEPVGKGRPRFVTKGKGSKPLPFPRAFTPKKTRDYEKMVKMVFLEAAKQRLLLECPVKIGIVAYYRIAPSKSKKQQALMESQQIAVTKKPDADNVIKIVTDGMNNVAYKDDAQVIKKSIEKLWSHNPRVVVWLRWEEEA